MDDLNLICRDERRRQAVRDQANKKRGLNGIDYVEIIEGSEQLELCVHFFGDVPDDLAEANVAVEGGTRIRDIEVLRVKPHRSSDPAHEDCLRVTLDKAGDFSCYKLCLYELDKNERTSEKPLKGFDPRYTCATFSFKTQCPSELDCREENICSVVERDEPEIDYLARDYAGFRQLLLDRMALLAPDWRERHVPDLGIALVEALAYAGDHLSYYQDAVATEAYLDTARKRISVRRHALLVDYLMHEGCNARAWVCVETGADDHSLTAKDFYFITGCAELIDKNKDLISERAFDEMSIPASSYEVFEPLAENPDEPVSFYRSHNTIHFYTWGDSQCCLPRGATRATLRGKLAKGQPSSSLYAEQAEMEDAEFYEIKHERNAPKLHLKAGDVLIFEEIAGAKNGREEDADPARRCAVRLTQVKRDRDPLTKTHIVEIEWAQADALPFELCLSARMPVPDCGVKEISVARGNVVPVDHGKTIYEEIGEVPVWEIPGECGCEGSAVEYTYLPGKFLATLKDAPLTFRQTFSFDSPASMCLTQEDLRAALPALTLYGKPAEEDPNEKYDPNKPKWQWHPKFDLLCSEPDEQSFVVEIDNDGHAHLRFGDGECGRMPDAGMTFTGVYRIGNGREGNTGPETIRHMITRISLSGAAMRPRNPLAAQGGADAEPISEVKMYAPGTFRKKLERAITAEDYALLAKRDKDKKVQRAAGRLRWTGSGLEARVDIDPFGTEELSGSLRRESQKNLHRYRRIGHDLTVTQARYVPLDIALKVLVSPHYLQGHVEAALREVFSNRSLAGGRRGFFHPDNMTFGGGIYLSALVAAALSVEGVTSVEVTKLQRLFEKAYEEIAKGVLRLKTNEVAQLDNDPNFPERGKLVLALRGGR